MVDNQNEPQGLEEQDISAPAVEQEATNIEANDDQGNEDVSQEQKVTFDEGQQAKVNELIGGKVAKQRAAEQKAEALQSQIDQMQSQMPTPKAPDIPDVPNPEDNYDDDAGLQAAHDARDAALTERAEFNAEQKAAERQTTAQTQQQANEAAQKQQENQEVYVTAAKSFGIEQEQIQKDAFTVSQYVPSDVQNFIVSDPQGPLISAHLAKDLVELDKVRSMTPLNAAIYIANEIKPKLVGIRKSTNAPDPADIVGGQGAPSTKHPALEGVKFE